MSGSDTGQDVPTLAVVTLAVAINNYHHPSAADVQTCTAITGNLIFVMHMLNTLQNIAIDEFFCLFVF